ncbi:MAG: hypothetical protein H7X92_09425 [Chitinophagales bacterium]|nr:hypothetical protein [Hyphomicrobiales bacterium]
MSDIVTDEMLMAFVDSELDDVERRRVERALAERPALRSRLRIFERTGKSLSASFETAQRAVPGILMNREQKLSFPSKWVDRAISLFNLGQGWALASAVLVAGFSAAMLWSLSQSGNQLLIYTDEDGKLQAKGALFAALETSSSEGFNAVQTVKTAAIIQSFMSADGRYCREYKSPQAVGHGVACRTENGMWEVTLHSASTTARTSSSDVSPAGAGGYQIIDGYVHQIMQGEALTPDAENAAIAKNWRLP